MKRPVLALFGAAMGGAWLGWTLRVPPMALLPVLLATLFLRPSARQLGIWSAAVLVLTCAVGHHRSAPHPIESAWGTTANERVFVTQTLRTTEWSHTVEGTLLGGDFEGARVRVQLPAETAGRVRIGDWLEGAAQYRRPDRFRNDGVFSYAEFLRRRGINGLLRMDAPLIREETPTGVLAWRRAWMEGMEDATRALFAPREADLLVSVWTGRSQLSEEGAASFRALGLSHLLAVSGLHVGILFGFMRAALGRFVRKSSAERIALLLLFAYAWIIGFPLSVVRATLMVAVLTAAKWVRRGYDPVTALLFAGTLILCLWPGSVADAGFHLSLAGVGAMVWLHPLLFARKPPRSIAGEWALTALAVQLMTLPLLLWHMGEAPVAALLANALLLPLFSLFVTGALPVVWLWFVVPWAAHGGAGLVALFGSAFFTLTEALAALSFPLLRVRWQAAAVAWWYGALWIALHTHWIAALPARWGRTWIGITAATALALMAWPFLRPPELLLIDIGQGDAALFSDRGRYVLIDTGGERPEMPDSAEAALLPSLAREGVARLDAVFLSHYDTDHIENLGALLASVPVEAVVVPAGLSQTDEARQTAALCAAYEVPVREAATGDVWEWSDRTRFSVLYAAEGAYNNDSTVLKITANGHTLLLPGDLEEPGEARLADADVRADWLKVGHHGSATSTGDAFLQAVAPKHALVSCGWNNRYGHPSPIVMQRLHAAGVSVHRTDVDGNLRLALGAEPRLTGYPTDWEAWRAFALSLAGFVGPIAWIRRHARAETRDERLPDRGADGVY